MDLRKKGKRSFFNKDLLYKTVGIIFILGILVLAVGDMRIYQKKQELTDQVSLYQKKIEDIKKSSQALKDEIANSNNVDYLEKLGYEQFDRTRPGETEYMFVGAIKKIQDVPKTNNQWSIKYMSGWFVNAWQWIKSKF